MSTINEKRDQRNKLMTDAQAILLASPDAEKRNEATRMLADADNLEQDVNALVGIEAKQTEERNRADKAQNEERSRTLPNRGAVETSQVSDKDKDRRSLLEYARTGKMCRSIQSPMMNGGGLHQNFEGRALDTTTSAALIPQSMSGILTEAQKSFGQILNYITILPTDTGEPYKIASVNDTAGLLAPIAEDTGVSENEPTINSAVVLNSDFLTTGVVLATLMQLNQANFNIESWISSALGTRYFRGLAKMVTLGNSSNIASIVTGAHAAVTTASPTAVVWADLAAAYGALDPAYEQNAVFSFNSFTRGYLMGVTDTLGQPLYTIGKLQSKVAGGFVDSIMGKEIVISQYMANANTATNVPILYGDHSTYLLRVVNPGLSFYTLRELYLASGQVGFLGYAMAGGTLIDAGNHPLLKVTMHA
jgi:HK97 family phage major capsid protein